MVGVQHPGREGSPINLFPNNVSPPALLLGQEVVNVRDTSHGILKYRKGSEGHGYIAHLSIVCYSGHIKLLQAVVTPGQLRAAVDAICLAVYGGGRPTGPAAPVAL